MHFFHITRAGCFVLVTYVEITSLSVSMKRRNAYTKEKFHCSCGHLIADLNCLYSSSASFDGKDAYLAFTKEKLNPRSFC